MKIRRGKWPGDRRVWHLFWRDEHWMIRLHKLFRRGKVIVRVPKPVQPPLGWVKAERVE